MREVGLQAHQQGFLLITVLLQHTVVDERTLTILCIVYIVAHVVHPQTSNCQIDL